MGRKETGKGRRGGGAGRLGRVGIFKREGGRGIDAKVGKGRWSGHEEKELWEVGKEAGGKCKKGVGGIS